MKKTLHLRYHTYLSILHLGFIGGFMNTKMNWKQFIVLLKKKIVLLFLRLIKIEICCILVLCSPHQILCQRPINHFLFTAPPLDFEIQAKLRIFFTVKFMSDSMSDACCGCQQSCDSSDVRTLLLLITFTTFVTI